MQLQVSDTVRLIAIVICHVNNIFRTRCWSLMYCVNLTETLHTHRSTIKLCCAFIDFSTAFDSVCRNILYRKLKEYGMSIKMLTMIMAIYKNVTSSVKIYNMYTDSFTCSDGFRQRDSF